MVLKDLVGLKTSTINALEKKNIHTSEDLLRVFPRKYLDYREIKSLDDALGNDCAIAGYVEKTVKDKANNVSMLCLTLIESTSGQKINVKWFGQAYLWDRIHSLNCKEIVLCGKVQKTIRGDLAMSNPFSFTEKEKYHGKIVPVYTKMKGISEDMHKKLLKECIDLAEEPLEKDVIQFLNRTFLVKPYRSTLNAIHYPNDMEDITKAAERIRMNDMLYFALKTQEEAEDAVNQICIKKDSDTNRFLSALPFALTEDQKTTFESIKRDLMSGSHVKALIQGDVGCGKTIVAFLLMMLMAENGYQSVLMAPTQVLAMQHYNDLLTYMIPYGYKVVCLTSNMTAKEKREVLADIKAGEVDLIVGTQSTFSEGVSYRALGLVITDEEHRFGVKQKAALAEKSQTDIYHTAHDIMMSATPIPRTMAEILFGTGRKIYEIKSMPSGRIPIQTAINNSDRVIFDFMEKQLREGRQCYVICPLVEENPDRETAPDSVEETYRRYEEHFAPLGYKVGMAFGMHKNKSLQTEVLESFAENKIQILVATTVVEVGVNVPNASLIVIHNAEHFGLSQLHQLRGRVGRGDHKSYCILKSSQRDNPRLKVLCDTLDGFLIAEEDLTLRGVGDLFGSEQTGYNHYVDLALAYPDTFKKITEAAKKMNANGYGSQLISLYET